MMKKLLAAAAFALGSGAAFAQMMGGTAITTTGYMPLVDGAHYEYMFTRGPWSSAMADLHGGQTWAGQNGLTAMHMTYTCAAGVPCAPDSMDFYRMDVDGMHYFGGTGADAGQHYFTTTYSSPEWCIQNPAAPGTMMPGGGYQNMGSWSTMVSGSGSMMGSISHMSTYRAMALETVTTPAGTFANTLHIQEQRGAEVRDVWYAQNVGIVMSSDSVSTMMLTGYAIPGGSPQPGGGSASLGFVPSTGMWWNSGESGTGYNLQVRHGTMVMTMFTYSASGAPLWYLGIAPLASAGGNVVGTGTLAKFSGGQCVSCAYSAPAANGDDGTFTATFTSANQGTLQLPGGRTVPIAPMGW